VRMNIEVKTSADTLFIVSQLLPFIIAPSLTHITSLSLSKYKLRVGDLPKLSNALQRNDTLTSLNLWGCSIGDKGVEVLAGAVTHAPNLVTLDLGWNAITRNGAEILSVPLKQSSITSLGLAWNELGNDGVKHIAMALKDNNKLTHLDLWGNDIKLEGVKHIVEALHSNRTLSSLGLQNNGVCTESITLIANLLKSNKTLTSLDLRANSLLDKGIEVLARGLSDNNTLKILDLQNNNISNEGVKIFTNYLAQNPTLEKLDLQWNSIGDGYEVIQLLDSIEKNCHLTSINLKGNKIGQNTLKKITEALTIEAVRARKEVNST